jgi:hypothetical protein
LSKGKCTLLDIFLATPQSSQRLIPIVRDHTTGHFCFTQRRHTRNARINIGLSCHAEGPIAGAYCGVNYEAALSKAKTMQQRGAISFGLFVWNGTNCCRFVRSCIQAGKPGWRHRFKLRVLWYLKPTPIGNIKSLAHQFILPENNSENTHLSPLLFDKNNVRSTLPMPEKPATVPPGSQWLSGEMAGSWYFLEKKPGGYRISRYSPEGRPECSGMFRLTASGIAFDPVLPYRFAFLSHCSEVNIEQNERRFTFLKISESNE